MKPLPPMFAKLESPAIAMLHASNGSRMRGTLAQSLIPSL